MIDNLCSALTKIRKNKPLLMNLTNYVTMDFMANCLLAIGAAPMMSCEERELEELIKISQAVNINIGTLDAEFVAKCISAAELAQTYHKPLILDPTGAGASKIRTKSARHLMHSADIIRGNASEIIALLQDESPSSGVESAACVYEAKTIADTLATQLQCTVVVSGETDYITDGIRRASLSFGSTLMPLVTGMGCTLTAVIAAFQTVINDSFEAAIAASTYFSLCGSLTHTKTDKPGSFRSLFIDELFAADFEKMSYLVLEHKDAL